MEQHAELLLAMESRIDGLSPVGEAVKSICSLFNFSDQEIYEVQLCIVEAASNSIKHAYNNEVGHLLEIKMQITGANISIQVCDTGTAMPNEMLEQSNDFQWEPENIPISLLPESGWGLGIIKKLMDHIDYTSDKGRNCLTMQKTIPSIQKIPN